MPSSGRCERAHPVRRIRCGGTQLAIFARPPTIPYSKALPHAGRQRTGEFTVTTNELSERSSVAVGHTSTDSCHRY